MTCPKCGYVLEPLDTDCARCGWDPAKKLEQARSPERTPVPPPQVPQPTPVPEPAPSGPPVEFALGIELDDAPPPPPAQADCPALPPPPAIPGRTVAPSPPPPIPDPTEAAKAEPAFDESKLWDKRRRTSIGLSVGFGGALIGLIIAVAVILVFAMKTYLRMLHEAGL